MGPLKALLYWLSKEEREEAAKNKYSPEEQIKMAADINKAVQALKETQEFKDLKALPGVSGITTTIMGTEDLEYPFMNTALVHTHGFVDEDDL